MLQSVAPAKPDRVRAQTDAPLLDVRDVTLRYKTPNLLVTATENVSFDVRKSDRFVLLGLSLIHI